MASKLQQHINIAPEWVNWVAQDRYGYWRGFDNRPVVGLLPGHYPDPAKTYECWLYDSANGVSNLMSIKFYKDQPNSNWKTTCKRARRKLKR